MKKRKHNGHIGRKCMCLLLSLVMVLTMSGTAVFADSGSSWSFTEPTKAMSTKGSNGVRNVKMNAFRASIPVAALLGADLVAGGNITFQTQDKDGNRVGLNLIGSDVNVNPDTYVWNFNYVSTFYNYKNQVRQFAWLDKNGNEVSNEEVWKTLPQSEFMYPILTYDNNSHNMYASWGGNDTDTGAIAELGGVSKTMCMRPDLVVGNDGTSYADQVNLIRNLDKNSQYYQEGDENYNPVFVETGCGTIDQKIDGVKIVANALNGIIKNSNGKLITRYGDPYVIATDYEKAIYGIYYYVMSNLEDYGGTIKKKNAAYVSGYNKDDQTYTVATTFSPTYQLLGTHTSNKVFGGVTSEGKPGETKTFKLTASDLAKFDFIYTGSDANKKQLFADFELLGLKSDEVPLVESKALIGVCNGANEWACNVITQEFPLTQLYMYKDELAKINPNANPMAMVAYIAENWYHISTNGSTLQNVVAKMMDGKWDSVSSLDNVPDKVDYVYSKAAIDKMIEQGIKFAKAHANDSSTWLDGSFNINDPIYKTLVNGADYDSSRVELTAEKKAAYQKNMSAHAWDPDLTVGIGKGIDGGSSSDGSTGGGGSAGGGSTVPVTPTTPETPVAGVSDDAKNAAAKFNDVNETSWFAEAVGYALKNNLFSGTSDKEFSPNVAMNRGMTVTVLYRMAGSPSVSGNASFNDVSGSAYYAKAVKWAADNNITSGTSATTFSPSASLTREQFVTLLYNYYKATGKDVSDVDSLSAFSDAGSIASYAKTPMQWAVKQGIISGVTVDQIQPKGNATRAQVAAMLMRLEAK